LTSLLIYYSRKLDFYLCTINPYGEAILSKLDSPNSTERLLNRIRDNKSQKTSISTEANRIEQTAPGKKIIKKSIVAGIVINSSYMGLALTGVNKANHQKELIRWQRVDLSDSMQIENNRFPAFLRTTIENFLGKYKKADIWTSIDTKDLRHKNLIVPDLPDSKIANAALWGLKKEYEILPGKDVFDFEIISDVMVDGIKKRKISAFAANLKKIQLLKQVFSTAGFPLKGIAALPFAFQNYFHEGISTAIGTPFVIVNVSRNHSDISCYSDSGLLLVRNIRSGSQSIADDFFEDEYENNSNISEILSLDFGMDSSEFENMSASVDRLVSKIVRTGDYCSNHVASNKPIEQYFIYGETDNCRAFMEFANANIPSQVDIFMPLETMTVHNMNLKPPVDAEDRNMVIPAAALALSSNTITPNFLYTFADKANEKRIKKINMGVTAAGLIILMACFAAFYYMGTTVQSLEQKQNDLNAQIAQYHPPSSKNSVTKQIVDIQVKVDQMIQYSEDYKCLAVINEISSIAPKNIFIEAFGASFEKIENDKKNEIIPNASLSGVVKAANTSLEPALTGFIIQLEDSPLFKNVAVTDKQIQDKIIPDSLNFTIVMEIN